jgi:hypothetical protein
LTGGEVFHVRRPHLKIYPPGFAACLLRQGNYFPPDSFMSSTVKIILLAVVS